MRIYTGDNRPLDFCDKCAPTEVQAGKLYGAGEGPDGRGNCFAYDTEHPAYTDVEITCVGCGKEIVDAAPNWIMSLRIPANLAIASS